jgi:methylated-DNA-[protein]-cysteine S-methyltransferase
MAIYKVFKTSFGWCGLIKGKKGLKRIFLPEKSRKAVLAKIKVFCPLSALSKDGFEKEIKGISAYFRGENKKFSFFLDFSGSTNFQRMVWSETAKIPYSESRSYKYIAQKIGNRNSSRAVGTALGKNLFPLAIPCHRVLRADGKMGGFTAAGGIGLKEKLLKLESCSKMVERPERQRIVSR